MKNRWFFAAHGPPQLRCQTNATGISTKVVRAVHPPAKSQRLLYDLEKWESFDSSPGKKKKVYMKIYCNNESTKNNGITKLLLCMSYALFEKTWPIQVNSDMIHQENSPFKVMPLFWQHFEHSTWWHGLKPPPRNVAAVHSFVDQGKAESPGLIWSFYGSKIPEWWNGAEWVSCTMSSERVEKVTVENHGWPLRLMSKED